METINDYSIRKVVKVNDTGVFVFFKDTDSAPLISFSELLTAVYGTYKHDVSLYSRQVKEEHRFLLQDGKIKRLVVDFEGAAAFMRDKMQEKFAREEIQKLSRSIDKLAHELPSPMKVSTVRKKKGDIEVHENPVEQLMARVDDSSIRYVKEDGVRWFNGDDLRRMYCHGDTEFFIETVEDNIREEDCAYFPTLPEDGIISVFINEAALETFFFTVDPDKAGEHFMALIDAAQGMEDMLEDNDVSTVEAHEEPVNPYETQEEEKEKDESTVESIGDVTSLVRTYSDTQTGDVLHLFTRDNKIYVSFPDLRNSKVRKDTPGDGSSIDRVTATYDNQTHVYMGMETAIKWYIKEEYADKYIEKLKNFMDPPPVVREAFPSLGAPTKRYTPIWNKRDELVGNTVAYVRLTLDTSILCAIYKKRDELYDTTAELYPAFKAVDVATFTGFTQGATLAKKRVSDEEYLKVSMPDIRINNVTMITYRGVLELVDNQEKGKWAVDKLREAVDTWLNENRTQINFEIEKHKIQENIQEVLDLGKEAKEAEATEQATEAVKEALSDPAKKAQIEEAIGKLPDGIGAMAAGLLGSLMGQQQNKNDMFYGATIINGTHVPLLIVKSPRGGITPYFEVNDFAKAWKLDSGEIYSRLSKEKHHLYTDTENKRSYLIYAELSDVISEFNKKGPTMVSKTMKASGDAFKAACKQFGISFEDDTKQKQTQQQEVSTDDPASMDTLLSRNDNGYAYTIGAIMLAEKLRALIAWFKNKGKNTDIEHLPGPTNNNVVKTLWSYIETQDATQAPSVSMQRAVVTAHERYVALMEVHEAIING